MTLTSTFGPREVVAGWHHSGLNVECTAIMSKCSNAGFKISIYVLVIPWIFKTQQLNNN